MMDDVGGAWLVGRFLSQAGVSHGLLYLVNGFLMVLIFFLARVVMIPVQFYIVFSNIRLFNPLTPLSLLCWEGKEAVIVVWSPYHSYLAVKASLPLGLLGAGSRQAACC